VPNRLVRFAGHHALFALMSIAEHVLGKPAHGCLLGTDAPLLIMLPLLNHTFVQPRAHNWVAISSRIGDEAVASGHGAVSA
jgi:hypothetical protein